MIHVAVQFDIAAEDAGSPSTLSKPRDAYFYWRIPFSWWVRFSKLRSSRSDRLVQHAGRRHYRLHINHIIKICGLWSLLALFMLPT